VWKVTKLRAREFVGTSPVFRLACGLSCRRNKWGCGVAYYIEPGPIVRHSFAAKFPAEIEFRFPQCCPFVLSSSQKARGKRVIGNRQHPV
jgi:hypothetical protein